MVRQSYVARGAEAFCRGEQYEVSSKEREKSCPAAAGRCGERIFVRGVTGEVKDSAASPSWKIVWRFLSADRPVHAGDFLCRYRPISSFSGILFDRVLIPAKGTWATVLGYFVILLIFLLLSLLYAVRNIWSNSLGTRISRDMRGRVFAKINALSLSFLDSRQAVN